MPGSAEAPERGEARPPGPGRAHVSVRVSLLVNYASQIYVSVVGLLVVPVYLRLMGSESYGLIGFFTMLLTCFNLLDAGMSSLVTRQSSRFRAGACTAEELWNLVRSLRIVFLGLGALGVAVLVFTAKYISVRWLNVGAMSTGVVATAVQLMAVIAGVRWLTGPYRGVISGCERLVWLGCFNAIVATFRYVGVIPLLIATRGSTLAFFIYQMLVALAELMVLSSFAGRLLRSTERDRSGRLDWKPFRDGLRFSMSIAFTSVVWVMLTQTDKLVLSHILSLATYGHFSVAVLLASGMLLLAGPVAMVIVPRLTHLEAQGNASGLISMYRGATQFTAVMMFSLGSVLSFFPDSVLYIWTGDRDIAGEMARVLSLYAFGNAVLTVSAFPYYLQMAKGDLRLHIIGNAIFAVVLIPAVIWGATYYGAEGAGGVWVGMNVITFFFWLPFVHSRFCPGLNRLWYLVDVLSIALPIIAMAWVLSAWVQIPQDRLYSLIAVGVIGVILLMVGSMSSGFARRQFLRSLRA